MAPTTGFAGITPEMISAMAELGLIPEEQALLMHSLKQAEMAQGTKMPEGATTGRVYTAASPVEHLAAALRAGKGEYEGKQIKEQLQGNIQRQKPLIEQGVNADLAMRADSQNSLYDRIAQLFRGDQKPTRPPGLDLRTGQPLDPNMTYMPRLDLTK